MKKKYLLIAIPIALAGIFTFLYIGTSRNDAAESFLTYEVKNGIVEDIISTTGVTVDKATYKVDIFTPPLLSAIYGQELYLNSNNREIESWTVTKVFLEAGTNVQKGEKLITIKNIDGRTKTLTSPFKGRLTEMNSVVGTIANDGFASIGAGQLIVKANVSVSQVTKINLNMPIAVLINETNTQTSGLITWISPKVSGSVGDKGESAYQILIKITPGSVPDSVREGMSVTYEVKGNDGSRIRYEDGELVNEFVYSLNLDDSYVLTSKNGESANSGTKINIENYRVKELKVKPGDIVNENDSIVDLINLDKKVLNFKSPLEGVVREVFTIDNSFISGSLMELGTGGIFANVQVSEFDISKVEVGQEVELFIGNKNESVKGRVEGIGQVASVKSGSVTQYDVIVKPEDSDANFLVDMSVTARIILAKKESQVVIPIQALYQENGKEFVKVVALDGTARDVEVKTGVRGTQYIEILNGLKIGDQVAIGKNSDSLEIPTTNDPFAERRSERFNEQTDSTKE